MQRALIRVVAAYLAAALTAGCFYSSATVNFRDFEGRGVSMARLQKRDPGVQHYGRVRVAARTWATSVTPYGEAVYDGAVAIGVRPEE